MSVTNLTHDSAVLQQVAEHWQKMAMLILWKTSGRQKVSITMADIQRFTAEFAPGAPTLYTHGHVDSFDFQVIDEASAHRIAEYSKTQRGTA